MRLDLKSLNDRDSWIKLGIAVPGYDAADIARRTRREPVWIHFGGGNIFRAFIAVLQQRLLESGLADKGIIAAETFDDEIISRIYEPHDNLCINVTLKAGGEMDCEVIASIAEAVSACSRMPRLAEIFESPSLQMASFTVTEKGYALRGPDGALLPPAAADIAGGPEKPRHVMGVLAAMLYRRYLAGGPPLAVVSMDNCSANGDKLRDSVVEIAAAWRDGGFVDGGFLDYLLSKISFPWSMIDKITPYPDKSVETMLTAKGVEGMAPIVTSKGTFAAAFVNAERPQYLVVEDVFPNGRPPLEKAGVLFTGRETVGKAERMKVTTCLNPLHTAMAVYGCLLGYTRISDEMLDADITALVKHLAYTEGLPVVTDPGIFSPRGFIDEVLNERLPNPFIPDTPFRIVTDTSQKVGIRFGETIKSYIAERRDMGGLVAIPLAIAGWLRFLLGVDDAGQVMEIAPDPLKDELRQALSGIVWNVPESYSGQLLPILSNSLIFGSDLTETVLAGRIETYFVSMLAGPGAVRDTLRNEAGK